MSMEPPRVLSWEGTLAILDELENGPRDTPERRATLEGARKRQSKIERLFPSQRKHAEVGALQ